MTLMCPIVTLFLSWAYSYTVSLAIFAQNLKRFPKMNTHHKVNYLHQIDVFFSNKKAGKKSLSWLHAFKHKSCDFDSVSYPTSKETKNARFLKLSTLSVGVDNFDCTSLRG